MFKRKVLGILICFGLLLFPLFQLLPNVQALDDGLCRTPFMGWETWNAFGTNYNEQIIRQITDNVVSSGMKDAGYTYVIIDEWQLLNRDANGNLQADPNRFPSGVKALADYVHSKGLKFGLYSSAGLTTCAGFAGSLTHETQDANLWASWGVDYLKYDNCGNQLGMSAQDRYTRMRDALQATGRPIVYHICCWGMYNIWEWGAGVGHMWRTTGDIQNSFNSVLGIMDATEPLYPYAAPGGWNDPDMLEVGNLSTVDENRSHFSLWVIMGGPLIAGNDLRNMTTATRDILINPEVIAVNQDTLTPQGRRYRDSGDSEVFAKRLSGHAIAVVLLNRGSSAVNFTLNWSDIQITGEATARDLWTKQDLGTFTGSFNAGSIPAHGVRMLKITPQNLIIDNMDPEFSIVSGTWIKIASDSDKYSNDIQYHASGTGANKARFTPNIQTSGLYNVFAWWPSNPNRATNTPYAIRHAGGTNTVQVNQEINSGKWNLLGTYSFNAGTGGYVEVSDNANENVIADAVMFEPATGTPTPTPSPVPGSNSVTYVATDTSTQGSWKGVYGGEGYDVINSGSSLPSYATMSYSGGASYTWLDSTTDTRALQKTGTATDRIAACYFSNTTETIDVNVTGGVAKSVAIYVLDWDNKNRTMTVDAMDGDTGTVYNTQNLSAFNNGKYLKYTVKGHIKFRFTFGGPTGQNAVFSGIFFGGSATPTPTSTPVNAVAYVATDTGTKGTWKGVYGVDGYNIINSGSGLPSYATMSFTGGSNWTWVSSTTDTRALQKPNPATDRIAACFFSDTSETVDMTISGGTMKNVEIYILDWDNQSRTMRVEALDGDSGTVLHTLNVSGFNNGQYLKYTAKGHVKFKFTNTGTPPNQNAVLSGVFFN